tara:strand:+ start:2269 stop:3102 length:834 start_codon:yes stop_codon:yes gene_type:complete
MKGKMMRNWFTVIVCVLGSLACEGDLEFVAPDPDTFVIQAFIFADEPVEWVTVSGVLPIDADSTEVAPVISNAEITISRGAERFDLQPTSGEPGRYHYSGDDLDIQIGDVFRLEATVDDRTATAETVVPMAPVGLGLSADSLIAPAFPPQRGQGPGNRLNWRITANWTNAGDQLHFVVIDNIEEAPQILPTTAIFSRFASRLIQQPTAADSSIVRVVMLTHYGQHRLKLYRVNEEYVDLYRGLQQDSRDLNEPPSNVHGALGIFSAFSADSSFFEVR